MRRKDLGATLLALGIVAVCIFGAWFFYGAALLYAIEDFLN